MRIPICPTHRNDNVQEPSSTSTLCIAFLADHEVGHVRSTLKLARALANKDHRICYLAGRAAEGALAAEGFEYFAHPENVDPRNPDWWGPYLAEFATGTILEQLMVSARPDVVLINSLYMLEALA